MRLRPLLVTTALAGGLIACDSGSDPAPAAADAKPATPAKPEAKPDAKADAKPDATAEPKPEAKPDAKAKPEPDARPKSKRPKPPKPTKPDAATAKKAASTFGAALQAGRKASKAKSYDEAITQFDAALKVDPNHPAVLGEKGWAAFNKGDLPTARRATERALQHVRAPKRKGALLYNLGRVLEAEGDIEAAIDTYTRSIGARPNDTVAKRLEGLKPKLPAPPPPPPPTADSQAGLDKLAQQLLDDTFMCDLEDDTECDCSTIERAVSPDPKAHILEAAVLGCSTFTSGMGDESYGFLVVRSSTRGWQSVARIADGSMPGYGYVYNDYEVNEVKFEQLFTGGEPELRVRVSESNFDGDYSNNWTEFHEGLFEWVCFRAGEGSRCVTHAINERFGNEKMVEDGPEPETFDEWDKLGETKHEWDVTFPGDAIVRTPLPKGTGGKVMKKTFAELSGGDGSTADGTIH